MSSSVLALNPLGDLTMVTTRSRRAYRITQDRLARNSCGLACGVNPQLSDAKPVAQD